MNSSPTWHNNFVYVPLCRVAPSPLPSRPASQTGSYAWSEGGSSSMHEGSSQQSSAAPSNADFSLHSPGQHLQPAPQVLMLYALTQRHGVTVAYLLLCLTGQALHHMVVSHSISEGRCYSSKARDCVPSSLTNSQASLLLCEGHHPSSRHKLPSHA